MTAASSRTRLDDRSSLVLRPAPTAILGPTNTGKTFFAIERMLAHGDGMIGLPLRLLAREVYDKLVARCSPREVALVTGEEKIVPPNPRYWVCTVEAMPLEREVRFLAIDEIQLAADLERGRIFTSRLLYARGREETLFLGSETMRPILRRLFPDIRFETRERLSTLAYSGSKKVTRLPRRTAVVAFSADTVYAVAELIRRQRGGAAVVLGALSPRTRNAQADLYQSGEVDYLVATDAIGMGLNMDIDHVAFAARSKFDGRRARQLRADELAQIAGRAGRHIRDGTFGVTGDCHAFDEDVVEAIEAHRFEPATALQWRSENLDFGSIPALMNALNRSPPVPELQRARPGDDEEALERLVRQDDIRTRARGGAALALLWDVCQIPDFRKVAMDEHARLCGDIFLQLIDGGRIDPEWLGRRVDQVDRTDGDIDSLSARIAHVRTWTYLSNRAGWLDRADYWQDRTRSIEDQLSDALHARLIQRFVDRRTSVLLKKLKDDAPLLAGVTEDGEVIVEGQFVGRLMGFEFIVDARASGAEAKRMRAAAEKAVTPMLAARAAALANARSEELSIRDDATIWWRSSPVARLDKGPTPLRPQIRIRGLDAVTPSVRGRLQDRLTDFVAARIEALLAPLLILNKAANSTGEDGLKASARGVAFRLVENFGAMSRVHFGDDLKQLAQDERAKLRQLGVRFGEYTLFMPALLKPAPARLLTMLWALWIDRKPAEMAPPKAGLVSIAVDESVPHAYYYASGYRPSGARAVRIDMLERLAAQIRNDRKSPDAREGFEATTQMMSLVGCSGEEFEGILKSLGYRKQTIKQQRPKTVVAAAAVPTEAVSTEIVSAEIAPAETVSMDAEVVPGDGPAPTAPPVDEVGGMEAAAVADGGPEPVAEAALDPAAIAAPTPPEVTVAPSAEPASEITEAAVAPVIDSIEMEEVEVEVWRFAPRRPTNRPRPQARAEAQGATGAPAEGDRGDRNHRHGRRDGGPGRPGGSNEGRQDGRPGGRPDGRTGGGNRNADPNRKFGKDGPPRDGRGRPDRRPPPDDRFSARKGAEGHAPRHRKVADPDSPFAVLASLKETLDGGRDGGSNKS